jgi:hypothetical protein
MKNKILIGTVAFVAILAVIGILAVSFTMTPVLATNATNATQTLTVGCTVAIKLEDNSSSGGSGSQTQTCLDLGENATVWSSNFTTDNNYTLQNYCWSNPTPPNDGLVVKNIGNNWVKIQTELLADNGAATAESFTGDGGGQFFVNANNGNDDNYGFDTSDACDKNLSIGFQELTIGGGAVPLCAYLDYHNNQNHLVVNDKWILNQKTPDTYTFLLQITASEATCNASEVPDPEDDFYTISYGSNLGVISFKNPQYTPVDANTVANIHGAAVYATDVAKAMTDNDDSSIYVVPFINSAGPAHLFFVDVDKTTMHFNLGVGRTILSLPTWNMADTPYAIGSNGGTIGTGGTGHIYILAENSGGGWYVYNYDSYDGVTTITLVSRTQIQTGGLPNFSKFIGLVFVGSDYYMSWVDSNGLSHITGFVAGGGLLSGPGSYTELPLYGVVQDADGGYLGLTWTDSNAALVHEFYYTYGPGAGDFVYAVDAINPFGSGGTPNGIDFIAANHA